MRKIKDKGLGAGPGLAIMGLGRSPIELAMASIRRALSIRRGRQEVQLGGYGQRFGLQAKARAMSPSVIVSRDRIGSAFSGLVAL